MFEAITALSEAIREVLVAVDILGLSYAEAGKALGVHPNTIPSRLARARLKVGEGWGDDDADPADNAASAGGIESEGRHRI